MLTDLNPSSSRKERLANKYGSGPAHSRQHLVQVPHTLPQTAVLTVFLRSQLPGCHFSSGFTRFIAIAAAGVAG